MPPEGRRDRDDAGRPRNARPRDALGRPLPRDATNAMEAEPPASSPEEALQRGIDHFNAGRFFQAHEAWEEAWHPSPDPERDFWQGLTQVAVGLTHRQRGNPRGAVTLLRRGAKRLSGYGDEFKGIPAARLSAFATEAADAIERNGADAAIDVPTIERRSG